MLKFLLKRSISYHNAIKAKLHQIYNSKLLNIWGNSTHIYIYYTKDKILGRSSHCKYSKSKFTKIWNVDAFRL